MAISAITPNPLSAFSTASTDTARSWIEENANWIADIITKHDAWLSDSKVEQYQAAYDGEYQEIEARDRTRGDGTNYKLVANYAQIIIDTVVDYMIGRPPVWTVEDPKQDDRETEETEVITEYRKKMMALLKDKAPLTLGEQLRQGCIASYSAVICWVDEKGNIDYSDFPVQEVIPVTDTRGQLLVVLRRYKVEVLEDGKLVPRTRVEVYDDRYLTYYISTDDGGFILDESEVDTGNPIEHKAGRIPVSIYYNGRPAKYDDRVKGYGKGDLDSGAFALIVAYSHGESDKAQLVEYLQDMYLLLTGVDVDENEVLKMRKARAIALKDANSKADFIAQEQADGAVEHYLDRLKNDIFDTTNTPKLSELSGATATEIKMKYAALDIKAGKKEPWLIQAINQLIQVLTDFLNTQLLITRGEKDPYPIVSNPDEVAADTELYQADWLQFSLVRNLPQNYKEIADIVTELSDKVPDSYLYELLWFIEDSQKALEEMKAQRETSAQNNLSALGYSTEAFNSTSTDDQGQTPPST